VTDKPRASVIEIIATGKAPAEDGAGSIIVPREVRINGVSVFTADRENRIKVSDITLGANMVEVTLTLVARRLVIAAEKRLGSQREERHADHPSSRRSHRAKPYSYRGEQAEPTTGQEA
jgi:hypothetical protein